MPLTMPPVLLMILFGADVMMELTEELGGADELMCCKNSFSHILGEEIRTIRYQYNNAS
jgi:hypothetical protein